MPLGMEKHIVICSVWKRILLKQILTPAFDTGTIPLLSLYGWQFLQDKKDDKLGGSNNRNAEHSERIVSSAGYRADTTTEGEEG